MSTQGAALVSSWSIWVHSLAASDGLVASSASAWLICDWMFFWHRAVTALAEVAGYIPPRRVPIESLARRNWV
jgi:hypothetical protein